MMCFFLDQRQSGEVLFCPKSVSETEGDVM